VLVEAISEGALTMGEDGVVLYCNSRFAKMLLAPLDVGALRDVLARAKTQVSAFLDDKLAACGCPILPIEAIDTAARLVLFVRPLGDVGIRNRPRLYGLQGRGRRKTIGVPDMRGRMGCAM
jgi:hypothetical protein